MTRVVPTAQFASIVYGAGGVSLADPAELFHEASRLYPNVAPARLEVLEELRGDGIDARSRLGGGNEDEEGHRHDQGKRKPDQKRPHQADAERTRA